MKRYLVITGDDFGFSTERNKGIMEAFNNGAVKSASLLLNCTGTDDGVTLFKSSNLCPGLHLNLTEGTPIGKEKYQTLTTSDGIFKGKDGFREHFGAGQIALEEIKYEIDAQIERYKQLMGTLPLYVDGHQHVHMMPDVVEIFADALKRNDIKITRYPVEINFASKNWVNPDLRPLLQVVVDEAEKAKPVLDKFGIRVTDCYAGLSTMGADMTAARLKQIIMEAFLDAEEKMVAKEADQQKDYVTCELMTHPGYPTNPSYGGFSWGSDDFGMSEDRVHEINILSSPEMMEFYKKNNIEIVSHEILLGQA